MRICIIVTNENFLNYGAGVHVVALLDKKRILYSMGLYKPTKKLIMLPYWETHLYVQLLFCFFYQFASSYS